MGWKYWLLWCLFCYWLSFVWCSCIDMCLYDQPPRLAENLLVSFVSPAFFMFLTRHERRK